MLAKPKWKKSDSKNPNERKTLDYVEHEPFLEESVALGSVTQMRMTLSFLPSMSSRGIYAILSIGNMQMDRKGQLTLKKSRNVGDQ